MASDILPIGVGEAGRFGACSGAEMEPLREGFDEQNDHDALSNNIRSDLENVLKDDSLFKGNFSYSATYSQAPNPALEVVSLGTVGVPLSSRDAEAIKSQVHRALFSKGEETVLKQTVHDTWEVDASKVNFANPAWPSFLIEVVGDVCDALGINVAARRPRCELSKLVLYETGSQLLPRVHTKTSDGMFATIMVVLPSEFTGGAAHLSHGELSTVYDTSKNSLTETQVLAWYKDVKYEIKPVTSGYRLALFYDLIHTTTSLHPAISVDTTSVQRLGHILRSWKENVSGDAPQKVVYLLEHNYSQARLCSSTLKGADAHKTFLLEIIAKQHGFHLGLANIEVTLEGRADDQYRGSRNPEDLDFLRIEASGTEAQTVVDLRGETIIKDLKFDEEVESIPIDLADAVEKRGHDHQEYEGYPGNSDVTLERTYYRSILVIWPSWANLKVRYNESTIPLACDSLRAITSPMATADQLQLADHVLRYPGRHWDLVLNSVCKVASTWKDLALWLRALRDCGAESNIAMLKDKSVHKGLKAFGIEAIGAVLEKALLATLENTARFGFLHRLEQWATKDKEIEDDSARIRTWIHQARMKASVSLRKPREDEEKLLLTLADQMGGESFFEDVMVPQLNALSSGAFLMSLANCVHKISSFTLQARLHLAKTLACVAVDKIDFPPVLIKERYGYRSYYLDSDCLDPEDRKVLEAQKTLAQKSILSCMMLSMDDRATVVMSKVVGDTTAESPADRRNRVKHVWVPLIAVLEDHECSPGGPPVPGLTTLCRRTITCIMDLLRSESDYSKHDDLSLLCELLLRKPEPSQTLSGALEQLVDLDTAIMRQFFHQLCTSRDRRGLKGPLSSGLRSTLNAVAISYAQKVELESVTGSSGLSFPDPGSVMAAMACCLNIKIAEPCGIILRRTLSVAAHSADGINEVLLPLAQRLPPALRERGLSATSEPFSSALRQITVAFVQRVLSPRPADMSALLDALQAWTCTCYRCDGVRRFLAASPAKVDTWTFDAEERRHIEAFLSAHAQRLCIWSTSLSPQGLTITKLDAVAAHTGWISAQEKGRAMLKGISENPAELQTMLGHRYAHIIGALGLTDLKISESENQVANAGTTLGSSTSAVADIAFGTSNRTPLLSSDEVAPRSDSEAHSDAARASSVHLDMEAPHAKRRKTAHDTGDSMSY